MDIKDLKGLMEAYQQVNAPEQLDEMDVKLKTPEERAKYIEDAKKREERKKQPSIFDYARKRKEEGRPLKIDLSRAVAAQNKKEAEKRAALKKEELDIFDVVLEFLQAEGFAETLEQAEWMMANVIDEEAIGIILGEAQLDEISQRTATRAFARRATNEFENDSDYKGDFTKSGKSKADETKRRIEKKHGKKAGEHAERAAHANTFGRKSFSMPKKPTNEEYVDEAQLDEVSDRLARAARNTRERRYNSSFGDGGMSANYSKQNAKKDMLNKTLASRAARTGSKIKPVDEDYVNEAQHARENPEKYEREQEKKSAPVRGEKTPMPPRGDKRREDFEKWYAKQMGR